MSSLKRTKKISFSSTFPLPKALISQNDILLGERVSISLENCACVFNIYDCIIFNMYIYIYIYMFQMFNSASQYHKMQG